MTRTYMDPTSHIDECVEDLHGWMTLDEKLAQLLHKERDESCQSPPTSTTGCIPGACIP